MSQFRKDPFGSAWVIISPERGLEPSDFGSAKTSSKKATLGPTQKNTFTELRAVRPTTSSINAPDWRMRVVADEDGLLERDKAFLPNNDRLFVQAASSGYQEIIVEHPDPSMTLEKMPKAHLIELIKLYRGRFEYLASKPGVRHIQLTRNVGEAAGASFNHAYAQLLAVPVSNRWVDEEAAAAEDYLNTHGSCLFCDVVEAELAGKERLISCNDHFAAVAPYASKVPFETWIFPRQHSSSFASLASNHVAHLADLLQNIVQAMNTALDQPPYNLMLHTFPKEGSASYHWHIELLPRLTRQAGFDWATGFYVNPTPPEDAARFLKGALALQEVHS